jgi:type VI secretion system secreted protein VgrG
MASDGKPFYRTEHVLRTIGGDDHEFIVWSFDYEDVFDEGYKLVVKCQIPSALEEGLYQACSSRRLKDAEFFLKRRFPDGQILETRVAGIIDAVERDVGGEPGQGRTYDMFNITIVPALEQLKLDQKGGTWHKKSHADILFDELKKGLEPYGRTVRRELTGEYPPIDFTVRQPHESLYDFALKLMERTGINFYFDHSGGVEQLVLCDSNDALPDISRRGGKPFRPQWDAPMGTDNEEWITNMNREASMVPAQVEFLGFDVTSTPQIPVSGVADIAGMFSSVFGALGGMLGGLGGALGGLGGGGGGGGAGAAIPGKISHNELFRVNELEPEKQFKERAKLHSEVEGNRASPFDGSTNITGAIAGRAMEVEVTPGELKKFVVTKVKASGEKLGDGDSDYKNTITAVPTTSESGQELPVRPTRKQDEPKHLGIYRAKVIAIENDPLDVDQFLRCRIEFPWDKQDDTPKETYVSVLQPMAGTHAGTQWLPRAGDRVLVTFVGGNAEQPVVLGSIYDNELKPPLMGPPEGPTRLPDSRSWLGWTYASVGDKARLSQLNIDTTAGQEMYFFNAPFDWRRIVGNDSKDEIERDEIRKVKRNFDETVDKDYKHHVGGNRDETVKGDYSLKIDGSGVIDAKQGLTATIGGSMSNNFRSGVTSTVDRQLTENINGLRATRATGPITFSSASSFVARAPTVAISAGSGGGMGAAAGGALDLSQDATLAAPRSSSISAGGSQVRADADGARMRGPTVALDDGRGGAARLEQGKLVVDAPQGIVFRCGANTLELAPDGLRINGMRVVIDAPQTELRTAAFDIVGPEDGTT